MWILFAFGSAVFAGLTSILAKCGIRKTDSDAATAIRTIVVLIFSWIMVFVVGAQSGIRDVPMTTWRQARPAMLYSNKARNLLFLALVL